MSKSRQWGVVIPKPLKSLNLPTPDKEMLAKAYAGVHGLDIETARLAVTEWEHNMRVDMEKRIKEAVEMVIKP